MPDAYFTTKDGLWFSPADHARGPWDVDACHAGPPTALMVRAVEKLVPSQQLVRLTVELIRPIPMAGFRVQGEVRRPGRSVTHTEAEIFDEDRIIARAYGMHFRVLDGFEAEATESDFPSLSDSVAGPFPFSRILHDERWFHTSVECRYDQGSHIASGGPTTMWMRSLHPIVLGEEPSAFQRIAPLADCGNGISFNGDIATTTFVNADLTLSLHRRPTGDWFASRSVSHWQPSGIGLADAELFDVDGPVGRAVQGLLLSGSRSSSE